MTNLGLPWLLNTIVGDIELRGRLLASMRLAMRFESASLGTKEKSVN